ncbi:hypothetical protein Pan161_13870 [Gimesia algae]|uniref:Uncharacterized protein n=1 Tax=Gimesia algae TaxID=2527971 RepID=A0A517V9S6_9PLAN|nr:hypothetical protein Pan161_13870 [Gimesia algae]
MNPVFNSNASNRLLYNILSKIFKNEIREKSEVNQFLRDCNPIVKLAVSNETQPGKACDLAAVNFLRDRNETHILKDSDGQEKSG